MSLIVHVNHVLPPLTKDQTHKTKIHVTFLSVTFMLYICVVPLNTTDKDCKYFYIHSTQKSISILFY